MTVYNIYYSPTGGTKKVAEIISGTFSESVRDIDILKKQTLVHLFKKEDICIISVPAFGGRVPENAVEKIKTFKADGTNAVIVAVFGNRAIDDTLIELSDIVTSVGFNVVAAVEAVAEHSLVRIYGSGRPNNEDKAELESFVKEIREKLKNNDRTVPWIPGNRPYKDFKSSGMSLVVDYNCLNCKKCSKECPVDAIPIENIKTVDTDKCFSCMHCVSACPMSARHNSQSVTKALEERLRERCTETKPNKLYL